MFLAKGLEKKPPARAEFTAYGQACLEMARGVFQLLRDFEAVVFACAIPRGTKKPAGVEERGLLRKDYVFLLERYFYVIVQWGERPSRSVSEEVNVVYRS
jgi:hypothetical protein